MTISNMFKKKKKHGFAEKARPADEIDREYNHHAIMYGHVSRCMHQDALIMEKNQDLLNEHMDAMVKLNKERAAQPPEKTKEETQPSPEGPAAA